MENNVNNSKWSKFFVLISILFIVFSFLGIVDSTFLTIEHFRNDNIICLIVEGCDTVLNSEYSLIFGIPVAILGLLYYISIFIFSMIAFKKKKEIILKHLSFFTIIGLIASFWFIYLQIFVIGAICTYCIISALISIILFTSGITFLYKFKCSPLEVHIE